MKKLLLGLLLCGVFSLPMSAQLVEGIDELGYHSGYNTIVRTVDQDNVLIYTEDGIDTYFMLYDYTNHQLNEFALPMGMKVHDMEVYNGNAYFIGEIPYGGYLVPVVGQFDIMDVFYMTGVMHYCEVSYPYFGDFSMMLTEATRMTVYDDGNAIYIYGVGTGLHYYTEPTPYYASTMFSATLIGAGWSFCMDYSKGKIHQYIDIDCTENYVGVTAIDGEDSAVFLCRMYPDDCFFMHSMQAYRLVGVVEEKKIRVAGMHGDRFSVAYQPQGEERVMFVEVPLPVTSPLVINPTSTSVNSVFSNWTLADFRYSANTDHVLLVGEMAFPPNDVWDHWVLDYEWTGGLFNSWTIPAVNSVDGSIWSSHLIMTGFGGLGVLFAAEDIMTPQVPWCVEEEVVTENPGKVDTWEVLHNHDECRPLYQDYVFVPKINDLDINEICR